MNTTAKLNQKIEPSISVYDFIQRLETNREETAMLMHNTLTRILAEIKTIETNEGGELYHQRPDFAREIELIQELCSYGLYKEAYHALTEMGKHIAELYSELLPWYRLQTKMFKGYVLPLGLRSVVSEHLFKRDIFIESHHESNGIIYYTWCWKGTQDNPSVEWNNSAVALTDLSEFALEKDMITGISDTCDHTGEHVQKELKTPLYIYVQEHIETIIKEYVKAGKEVVAI